MHIAMATEPAKPDRPNEDYAGATTDTFVIVDGAGTPAGSDSGCIHGVTWFARQLGSSLLHRASTGDATLREALAEAIDHVANLHQDTCDLTHPGTPSGTVTAVRIRSGRLEYLVLADSPLVIRYETGDVQVVMDDREARIGQRYRQGMDATTAGTEAHDSALREYVETLRSHRNQPDGFWVASSDPSAAGQALIGSADQSDLRDLALLSDGASRSVDRFGVDTWAVVLDRVRNESPLAQIRAVRTAERADAAGRRWPRGKASDDATLIYVSRDLAVS